MKNRDSSRLTDRALRWYSSQKISRFSELATGDPSPGLVLLATIRVSGLWIEFADEKISSRMGSSYCGLAVPQSLAPATWLYGCHRSWRLSPRLCHAQAFNHVASSRTSSSITAVAPQPVSATVSPTPVAFSLSVASASSRNFTPLPCAPIN